MSSPAGSKWQALSCLKQASLHRVWYSTTRRKAVRRLSQADPVVQREHPRQNRHKVFRRQGGSLPGRASRGTSSLLSAREQQVHHGCETRGDAHGQGEVHQGGLHGGKQVVARFTLVEVEDELSSTISAFVLIHVLVHILLYLIANIPVLFSVRWCRYRKM